MLAKAVRWATAAMAAAALLAGGPLRAQPEIADAPIPRTYPASDSRFAYPIDDPVRIDRDRQTADENARQCALGQEPSWCTMLGLAYRDGEGRPQNRPVAELIFREACAAGEAKACEELAELLNLASANVATPAEARFLARACDLGKLSVCDRHAELIESGIGQPADINAADAVRARACDSGNASSCIALARSLTGARRAPDKRAAGIALIERLCRSGDRQACGLGAQLFGSETGGDPTRARAYRESACTSGDPWECNALAKEALRTPDTETYGEGIARALRFFDLACAGVPTACRDATVLRTEPGLQQDCYGGARAACFELAGFYRQEEGVLANEERALWLLAWLCETASDMAEQRTACGTAGRLALDTAGSDRTADPVRAQALLMRGCDAGDGSTCLTLAQELTEARRLPQDLPRGYALFDEQCAIGADKACRWLRRNIADDPATPLAVADADYTPPDAAEAQPPEREPVTSNCTTTTVEYRGTAYVDTICPRVLRVFNGTPVVAGTTPWQALIWRPQQVGTAPVARGYNVLCGGTVILTGWVLTAAHCLRDQGRDIRTTGHTIRLGVSNPLSPGEGHSYPIVGTHKPKEYVGKPFFKFDIALIEYDPRAGRRGSVAYEVGSIRTDPKPFAARNIAAGTRANVYGWGSRTVEGSVAPPVLLQGVVRLRTMASCDAEVDYAGSALLSGSVLCGDGVGGQQACKGDSGGPVIVYEALEPGGRNVPVLVGVVSSGVACGTSGKPSRYTRLKHPVVQSWLASVLPPAAPRSRPQGR